LKLRLRLGIRQWFVLDTLEDDHGNPIPVEVLLPRGELVVCDDEGEICIVPKLYTHRSIQVGFGWNPVVTCGVSGFLITTEVKL
jgi:hypothetical protein